MTFYLVADHPRIPESTITLEINAPNADAAHDAAMELILTYDLLGTFIPFSPGCPRGGHYLFVYTTTTGTALSAIEAVDLAEAEIMLAALAQDGVLVSNHKHT